MYHLVPEYKVKALYQALHPGIVPEFWCEYLKKGVHISTQQESY